MHKCSTILQALIRMLRLRGVSERYNIRRAVLTADPETRQFSAGPSSFLIAGLFDRQGRTTTPNKTKKFLYL